MDLSEHMAIGLPGAAGVYLISGNPWAALAYGVGAILIDTDHLVDYWRETGFNTNVGRFMRYFEERHPTHSWLCLHAWEWPLFFLAAALTLGAPAWAWGLALGAFGHLILDQRFNRLHRYAYWFSFRWSRGFNSRSLYDDSRQGQV